MDKYIDRENEAGAGRLFLLDAFALIFRAYYALIKVPRITSSGMNTSAVFGFVNTLEELLRKERPTHLGVCFDPQGPTFRHKASEEYKSERAEMPEDIRRSLPYIHRIVKAYGLPDVVCDGFEADDVIGTLARQAASEGYTTYMMTPDKDFGQLVTDNILQYKPSYRGQDFELRGPAEICAKYGLQSPLQVIDLLALMGDKIDNIPGCPGVGEKTAVKLIGEFGSVEQLLAGTDRLKGALKRKIEDNREQIEFSKFLATIRTDAPVKFEPETFAVGEPDREALFAIFEELEFRQLRDRVGRRLDGDLPAAAPAGRAEQPSLFDFDATAPAPAAAPSEEFSVSEYNKTETAADLERLNTLLAGARRVAVACVCEGDSDFTAELRGVGLSLDEGGDWYITPDNKEGIALLLDTLARRDIEIVSADCKRDYVVAARLRGDSECPLSNFYDISLAHYLIQPEQRHDVVSLAETYLHRILPVPAKPAPRAKAVPPTPQEVCTFSRTTLDLRDILGREIADSGMKRLLTEIELPMVTVLAGMEIAGVRVDVTALEEAAEDMRRRIAALETEIYDMTGLEFNIGSPSKVGEVLFDHLHLDEKAKKTKSGHYSTSEEVLQKLLPLHPVVEKILMYRSLKKLLSTYLMALPSAINPTTGRIHTTYNQTVTATGRISSSNPNLQNIPIREGEGREIRRAFIASPGCRFLSADYSQIELRLVADFAGEATMIDAFRTGKDIHAITAARIYDLTPEEVSADQRRHAKTANFGILYGISAFGLAQRLGIPRTQAKELIDGYFRRFPDIRAYMEKSVEEAREKGYTETRFGRRRYLPDISSRNPVVRGYAERNAVNAPVQGTAADIIKRAMVSIDGEIRSRGLKAKMIMQVHDELNFDVPEEEVPVMQEIVSRCMEAAYSGEVPLTAEVGVAMNWLDAH